jgi:hypothetical protein
MKFETFKSIIDTLKKQDKAIHELYKNKVDLIDFVDPYHYMITLLIKEVYGEEGRDWFDWFCYDSEYGEKDWSVHVKSLYKRLPDGRLEKQPDSERKYGAYDKDNNPICYDTKSTWEYLEQLKK